MWLSVNDDFVSNICEALNTNFITGKEKEGMSKGNDFVGDACHISLRILVWFSAVTFWRGWGGEQEQQHTPVQF